MKFNASLTYIHTKATLLFEKESLSIGEKLVFLLIMGLLEKNEQLTLFDIVSANKPTNQSTTRKLIDALKAKGYFTTQRSNQFFSRAYITPTEKAFLLLRSFRSLVASLSLG